MRARPSAAEMIRDAEWLAHRYDPARDAFHLRRLTREGHGAATFLTDDLLPPGETLPVSRESILAAAPPPGRIHFIFHSAYCCSTLLARAFDLPGVAMGLKEPVLLNDLVGWRHRGSIDGAHIAMVLDHSLRLLERPFAPGEAVVVKPSNVVNPFAAAMLGLRPEARALLLHAPLEAYLASIARKGMWGRLWVRDLMTKLLREPMPDLGIAPDGWLTLTDIQIAAIGWLVQHAHFAALAAQFGPDRIATLDSEALMARPAEAMAALGRLYGLEIDVDTAARIAAGPAFTRHSKSGVSFDADARAREAAEGFSAHAEEVRMVAEWARALAANAGIALTLPAPLLD